MNPFPRKTHRHSRMQQEKSFNNFFLYLFTCVSVMRTKSQTFATIDNSMFASNSCIFCCFSNFHSNKYSHFQSSCTFPSNKISKKKIEIRKFRKLNQFLLHNMHLFCFFLLSLLLEVTTTKIREKISFFVTTRTVCSCVCM